MFLGNIGPQHEPCDSGLHRCAVSVCVCRGDVIENSGVLWNHRMRVKSAFIIHVPFLMWNKSLPGGYNGHSSTGFWKYSVLKSQIDMNFLYIHGVPCSESSARRKGLECLFASPCWSASEQRMATHLETLLSGMERWWPREWQSWVHIRTVLLMRVPIWCQVFPIAPSQTMRHQEQVSAFPE